jgi:hypothetical protein
MRGTSSVQGRWWLSWIVLLTSAWSSAAFAQAAPSTQTLAPVAGPGAGPVSTPPGATPAPSAGSVAAAGSEPGQPSEQALADQDDAAAEAAELQGGEAVLAPPGVAAGADSQRALREQLSQLREERSETTNLWPWLAVGAGASAVLVATVVGTAKTFSCDEGCEAPPWVGLVAVVGATIGTVGAIWLVRVDRQITEIELQQRKVQGDLQLLEHARLRRERGTRAAPAASLRWTF